MYKLPDVVLPCAYEAKLCEWQVRYMQATLCASIKDHIKHSVNEMKLQVACYVKTFP